MSPILNEEQRLAVSDAQRHRTDEWIARVREADANAEALYRMAMEGWHAGEITTEKVLLAIAAELRAQRIARRPGLGKS